MEVMELVRTYNQKGLTVDKALSVAMMPHSTYYQVIKSELEREIDHEFTHVASPEERPY